MSGRFEGISDSQWDIIKPLLPEVPKRVGRLEQDGVWERVKNSVLCMADLAKLIDWAKGAINGSFPPR